MEEIDYRWFHFVAIAVLMSILNSTSASTGQLTSDARLPEKLKQTIVSTYPGFRLITNKDIDWSDTDCGKPTDKDRTIIRADFNGDGVSDYSVLLFGAKERATKSWWKFGESTSTKLKLVVFLGEKNSLFKIFELAEQDQNIPIWHVITLLEPSVIDDVNSSSPDGKVLMKHPGIALIRCGGGEGYFYWDRGKFREAITSK